jgi:hypothetical protein
VHWQTPVIPANQKEETVGHWYLTPVILDTLEAEISGMAF